MKFSWSFQAFYSQKGTILKPTQQFLPMNRIFNCKIDKHFWLEKKFLKLNWKLKYVVVWNFYRYEDLKQQYASEIEYIPGGSGQNALRTASVSVFF